MAYRIQAQIRDKVGRMDGKGTRHYPRYTVGLPAQLNNYTLPKPGDTLVIGIQAYVVRVVYSVEQSK